jgi:hypothetical protein
MTKAKLASPTWPSSLPRSPNCTASEAVQLGDRAREGQPRTASDAVLGGSAEVVKKISAFQTCNALVFVRKRCQNFLQNKSEEKR